MESEEGRDPNAPGRAVVRRWRLDDPLRRAHLEIALLEDGYLEIVGHARRAPAAPLRLDLRYLDPVPTIVRVIAAKALRTALGAAAVSALAFGLARFDSLAAFAEPSGLAAATVALGAALLALCRSCERTEFYTLHGRARVIALVAHVGGLKRVRAFVPELSRAIEEAAERITGDTSAYLRAEMREHYRLRGADVISADACAESTGRILAQFDVEI